MSWRLPNNGAFGSKFADYLAQELSKPGAREITFALPPAKVEMKKVYTPRDEGYPTRKKEKPKAATKAAPGQAKRKVILEDE